MYVWISTWLGKYLRKTHSEDNFCFLCDFLSISWRHPVDFCIWEGSAFFELEIYKYKFLPCKQILFDRLLLAGFLFFVATVAFYYCVPTPGIFVYYDNWIFTEWKTKLGGCFEAKQVRVPIGGGTCLLIGIGTLGYQKKKKKRGRKGKKWFRSARINDLWILTVNSSYCSRHSWHWILQLPLCTCSVLSARIWMQSAILVGGVWGNRIVNILCRLLIQSGIPFVGTSLMPPIYAILFWNISAFRLT